MVVGFDISVCRAKKVNVSRAGKNLDSFFSSLLSGGRLLVLFLALVGLCPAPVLWAQEPVEGGVSFVQTVDMVSAIYEEENKQILFSGKSGVLGTLSSSGADMVARLIRTDVKDDLLVIEKVVNGGVLLGSSKGDIYSYQGGNVKKIVSLSQYSEPILDIDSSADMVWVSGGRGLLATSSNGGADWTDMDVGKVIQPALDIPSREPRVWYLGVSNIDSESVVFNASVNGRPAILDEDFEIDVDEGRLIVINTLDQGVASISFTFQPGPPYRGGDVTWSTVIAGTDVVTLVGEFGFILQSEDGGNQWIRRDGVITQEEPAQPYWLCGAARGNKIILGGAAGKVHISEDNGVSWRAVPIDSQEGIFGVDFIDDDTPIVAGAVGLLGIYQDGGWRMADRTVLGLRSWVKNLVNTDGGVWMALGGRSTALSFIDDSWKKWDVAVSIGGSK